MGQDGIGTWPVTGVLTHVGPHNGAVCVNYEHGGRSHAITQQVEHLIGIGRGVAGQAASGKEAPVLSNMVLARATSCTATPITSAFFSWNLG